MMLVVPSHHLPIATVSCDKNLFSTPKMAATVIYITIALTLKLEGLSFIL